MKDLVDQLRQAGRAERDTRTGTGMLFDRAAESIEHLTAPGTIRLFKDGNAWCCVQEPFINIAESDAHFGDTPEEALAAWREAATTVSGGTQEGGRA